MYLCVEEADGKILSRSALALLLWVRFAYRLDVAIRAPAVAFGPQARGPPTIGIRTTRMLHDAWTRGSHAASSWIPGGLQSGTVYLAAAWGATRLSSFHRPCQTDLRSQYPPYHPNRVCIRGIEPWDGGHSLQCMRR